MTSNRRQHVHNKLRIVRTERGERPGLHAGLPGRVPEAAVASEHVLPVGQETG